MRDTTVTRTARYPGSCSVCREPFAAGEKIARKENRGSGWQASRWNHARCEVTWLCDGRAIPGGGGVILRVALNALGERVGDNAESVLAGIAEYAPDGRARAEACDGLEALTGSREVPS